jgi:hypothetical protein
MYEISWQMVSPREVEELKDLRWKIEAERGTVEVISKVSSRATQKPHRRINDLA